MEMLELTVGEMRPGDVVHAECGMRCLVDREPRLSTSHAGGRTYYTAALVVNRDEVPNHAVPLSWTHRTPEEDRRRGVREELRVTREEHRWTLQGNDMPRWQVERPGARFRCNGCGSPQAGSHMGGCPLA